MTSVSVIVCTRNRVRSLIPCLDSIAAAAAALADEASIEVIVVDNGSSDGTDVAAKDWAASAKTPLRRVSEPRRGLARARNTGVLHAAGDILLFTDDDCRLAPDYLSKMLAHYSKDTGPVIRGGRVLLGDPTDHAALKTSTQDAVLTSEFDRDGFIMGGNMTMQRTVPRLIGPFDERFGAGGVFNASEETDFIYRAYAAGIRIEYKADMLIYHWNGRKDIQDVWQVQRGYWIGIGALRAKQGLRNLLRYTYYDVRNMVQAFFAKNRPARRRSTEAVCWPLIGVALYFFTTVSKRSTVKLFRRANPRARRSRSA